MKLVLDFEFCDEDLKKYMDTQGERGALHPETVGLLCVSFSKGRHIVMRMVSFIRISNHRIF
jgi:hypothetical protein